MDPETFVDFQRMLPLRDVTLRKFDAHQSAYFGVVADREGNPSFIVRDVIHESDYSKLRTQYEKMENHGIKVASHYPVITETGLVLVVDYIEGEDFREWLKNDIDNEKIDIAVNHAIKLARYYTDCMVSGEGPLGDVCSAFQYVIAGNEPVLIDLDSSPFTVVHSRSDDVKHQVLGDLLCDVVSYYGSILPDEVGTSLARSIDGIYQQFCGGSILVEETAELDQNRYTW